MNQTRRKVRVRMRPTHLSRKLVDLDRNKVVTLVKVHRPKLAFLDKPVRNLALEFHHMEQHLIVGAAGKEDLARIQLVECATDRPHVERTVIGQAKD
jgi:hypothetical protein